MLHQLTFGRADNSYYQKLDYYLKPDLLILDELIYQQFFKVLSAT